MHRSSFVTLLAVAAMIIGLILRLLDLVEPHHSAKAISQAITARAGPADMIGVEGSLEYSPALPFYTGRRVLLVNGDVGHFSFASQPPEANGVFIDTRDLIRLWDRPQRVFLVVRRPRGQSVVAALRPGAMRELGRYGSRWLYSNR